MKKLTGFRLTVAAVCCAGGVLMVAQNRETRINGASVLSSSALTNLPYFVQLQPGHEPGPAGFESWFSFSFNTDPSLKLEAYKSETDLLGITHTRYRQYCNNYPVDRTTIITHSRNGKIYAVNGDFIQQANAAATPSLSENQALQKALDKVKALVYKWENKDHEAALKAAFHNSAFSFFPKGELTVVHKKDAAYTPDAFRLAWKFNIYAEVPLYRANVFVDALTGEILDEQSLICTVDVVGTASTMYSGNVQMTSDNYAPNQYRLRETGRGNGIETYNLNNSMNYSNTDFTNNSSNWNLSGNDQAAADAHWGAEMTYDYYLNNHNRNSIDGNGYALLSYVHYGTNYVNAFWDGTEMTYGDGDVSQGFTIMTALDVCGHEITHGLTENTANLGNGEAGALNEGFSDIFGTTIEWYARPSQHDWLMGADITSGGIRDMSNPNGLQQPDTYNGTYWDPNGEVHNNNGPCIYWYYLMCQGGTGTNDNGSAYNVVAIGMTDAAKIAFRGLTYYFTPSTDYANARTLTLQAADDLFGSCSQQYKTCTNAWYAVGVGAQYSPTGVAAAFNADMISSCVLPANVNFINTTSAGLSYMWDFGDGSTSTASNPSHQYTQAGTYTVKLVANGCSSGQDSVIKTSYISINPPAAPAGTGDSICNTGSVTLSASGGGTLDWYDAASGGNLVGSGTSFTTPALTTTTTYYVSSSVAQTPVTGAPALNTTLGGGGYLNYSHYLTFDVYEPLTIQTVDIWASSTGTRTIELQDNSGTVMNTTNVNVTATGKTTVTLNFHVSPGTGYQLAATGSTINLYRNNTGAAFPYSISSLLSITGTDVSASYPSYYYWFYNWSVVKDPCVSALTPVTATVYTCTGIENAGEDGLSIYPNPAKDNISISSAAGEILSVKLFDQSGREVMKGVPQSGQNSVKLDLRLADGVYFLIIQDREKTTERKIIVQQ